MKPKARKFRIKRAAPGTTLRTETAAAPDDDPAEETRMGNVRLRNDAAVQDAPPPRS